MLFKNKKSPLASVLSLLALTTGVLGTQSSVQAATLLNVTPTSDATTLAGTILGSGITLSNPVYTGAAGAAGTFSNGNAAGLTIDSGILLSSGKVADASDISGGPSTSNGQAGDSQLSALLPGNPTTFDASELTFDFTLASGNTNLFFNYFFASTEYQSYANSAYNDVFGFFLDGKNIALLPGTTTPVAINTVNGGNPLPTSSNAVNPSLFVNNRADTGTVASKNLAYPGFTVPLTATATGLSAGKHTIKLAIADTSDHILDSTVFIQGKTFSTVQLPPTIVGDPTATPSDTTSVPEPSSVVSTLALGVLGAGYMLKRKLQHKAA